ncbi:hypothetical protein MMC31_003795 [Peltigera leucophlebia]|nr:hypothetical protein [Peltigera leucophlebia]
MSNNIGLPITGSFPSSTAASSSNMTAGETATGIEATSPSCSHAAAVIPSSSITSSTSSSFEAPPALSLVSAHEGGYKHSDIATELSTISPESIILTHGKIFVKTADLAYFSFGKNVSFKQKPYLFPTNTSFEKMKAHLWKCSKIDLTGGYAGAIDDDKTSVLTQVQQQGRRVEVKGLLGLSVFEKIQGLIRLVVGMHIAFSIVENPAFQALLSMFSSTLAAWIPSNGNNLQS